MSKARVEKEKVELVKEVLKELHKTRDVERVKEKFREVLAKISPFEIPLIEQELVREGVNVGEILRLCDLHVELFREFLVSRELEGLPEGHPLEMLLRENEHLMKKAESLNVYAQAILNSKSRSEAEKYLEGLREVLREAGKIKLHYRKLQMLIFPYLERRGINAVPRVLWGREDEVIVKLRKINKMIDEGEKPETIAGEVLELAREIGELVFRENKILYPAISTLFSEGEWAAISELAEDIGYIVDVEKKWKPGEKPIMPYELEGVIPLDKVEKLPPEFKAMALSSLTPDSYEVRRSGDLTFKTGFLNFEELEGILKHLPVEVTFADGNDRIRFYTQNVFHKGFPRTKTIIGRRLEYCHPPRLEKYVKLNVEKLKSGEFDYREFWTRSGDRILRVLIVGVKSGSGEYLGTLEVVEDLTEVLRNPEKIMEKILVL